MRKVLVSLKPYYYYLVGEGIKTIEVRKDMPKANDWNKEVFFYMSKDIKSFAEIPEEFQEKYRKYRKHFGKVGMRFVCDNIEKLEEHIEEGGLYYTLNSDFNEATQLDNWQLHDYGKGKPLYGWHISDLKIYDKPKALEEFSRFGYIERGCACANSSCKYHHDNGYYEPPHCKLHGSGNCSLERAPQSWGYVKEEL